MENEEVAFLKVIILIYRGVIFNLIELIIYSESFIFVEEPAVPSHLIHFVSLPKQPFICALFVVNVEKIGERLITFKVFLSPNATGSRHGDVEVSQWVIFRIVSDQIGCPVLRK